MEAANRNVEVFSVIGCQAKPISSDLQPPSDWNGPEQDPIENTEKIKIRGLRGMGAHFYR